MSKYSESFEYAAAKTLVKEAGYVKSSVDPGGETKYGISKRAYPDVDIKGLTRDKALEIYYRDYWKRLDLDRVENIKVAAEIFDSAVLHGTVTAVKFVQQALNRIFGYSLVEDGKLGDKTILALNKEAGRYPDIMLAALNLMQGVYMLGISTKNPANFKAHAKGWMKRLLIEG